MFASYPKIHPIQLATINPNVMWVLKGFLEQQVCWELQVLLLDADLLGLEVCQLETEAGWENQPKTMSHSVRIMHSNVFWLPNTPQFNWLPSIPMWVLEGFLEQVCWELQVLLLDVGLLGLERLPLGN